jgi:hypothetical protein
MEGVVCGVGHVSWLEGLEVYPMMTSGRSGLGIVSDTYYFVGPIDVHNEGMGNRALLLLSFFDLSYKII